MSAGLSGPVRRLLMTTDAVGGVWSYTLDLARGLSAWGVAATVAVLGPACSQAQRREAGGIADLTLIETGLPLDWLCDDPHALRGAAAAISALAAQVGAQIVQLNGSALASEADYGAPVVAVHHSCLATWWASVKNGPLPQEWRWRAELVRRHLAQADRVVAPSAAFAALTAATYDLTPPPQVIRNGRSRAASGRPHGPPLDALFTAGRLWDEGKNIATMDRAAALVDAPFFAAGPLCGPNGARAAAGNLQLQGELTSGGVRDWLAKRPIFVSSAIYEPFGLAALEAAQAGCALVLSDIPTFRELWADAALFAPARDPAAFVDAVNALLRDRALRRRMGRAARDRGRRYSLEYSAKRMMALYQDLARSSVAFAAESAA
jgi:glycosyltransferase involved in cell wall biosynthesis